MFRSVILAAARSHRVGRLVEAAPLTRAVAEHFIAGQTLEDAVAVTQGLVSTGLSVTVDHLTPDAEDRAQAEATARAQIQVVEALSTAELTPAAEVTVRLSAIGGNVDRHLALDLLHDLCATASEAGTTVTLEATGDRATDTLLDTLAQVRGDFPTTGVGVNASLRRSEADCRELAHSGARVRLARGPVAEPESVAYQTRLDVDRSYVRCLKALLDGPGYPMIATHDERLIAIAEDRAAWFGRTADTLEFQMVHGMCLDQRRRLVAEGYTVRVYLAFGPDWYRCLVGRVADRPVSIGRIVRSLRTT